jgi:flagellar motility protein MotE (MotC chaperone)
MKWLMIIGFLIIAIIGIGAGLYFSGTVKFPFLPPQKSAKIQTESASVSQSQTQQQTPTTISPAAGASQNNASSGAPITNSQKNIIQSAADKVKQQEVSKLQRDARILSNMDPSDAAKIIDNMDDTQAAKVLSYMDNKEASDVLSELTSSNPKKATKLLNMMGVSPGG